MFITSMKRSEAQIAGFIGSTMKLDFMRPQILYF